MQCSQEKGDDVQKVCLVGAMCLACFSQRRVRRERYSHGWFFEDGRLFWFFSPHTSFAAQHTAHLFLTFTPPQNQEYVNIFYSVLTVSINININYLETVFLPYLFYFLLKDWLERHTSFYSLNFFFNQCIQYVCSVTCNVHVVWFCQKLKIMT